MKLVSPDALDVERRGLLDQYMALLPPGSVCVNLVLGHEAWDVRPVFLVGGKVRIARLSVELDSETLSRASAEIEAFSLLFDKQTEVSIVHEQRRLLVTRPFFECTLQDEIEQGSIKNASQLEDISRKLITVISVLSRRSVVHGHISPANIVVMNNELVLIDPMLGSIQGFIDGYSAPETTHGQLPSGSADIFSLGKMLQTLRGDSLSERQDRLLDQLTLSSPKHRASLAEVSLAFGSSEDLDNQPTPDNTNIDNARSTIADSSRADAPTSSGLSSLFGGLLLIGGVIAGILYALLLIAPFRYYQLAEYLPILATQYSQIYEDDWASRERSRMSVVARAAVLRGEPAAISAIMNDISTGENIDSVRGRFLRIAFNEDWKNELSSEDIQVALALGLQRFIPRGAVALPPLESLHPGVLLAILAETDPSSVGKELAAVKLSVFKSLPEPFRSLFAALQASGVKFIEDGRAIGVAAIATGDFSLRAVGSVFPESLEASKTKLLLGALFPLLTANPSLAATVGSLLEKRPDSLGEAIRWFSGVSIADWSKLSSSEKIVLIIGNNPPVLSYTQWSDLLTFPLPGVRQKAALFLKRELEGLGYNESGLLEVLRAGKSSLNREQVIALLSLLRVDAKSRLPFISAWLQMKPPADFVVLALVARSHASDKDALNIEAARYVREKNWKVSLDVLTLLARHPEPLARMVAYAKLSPTDANMRKLLQKRAQVEDNDSCKKFLETKLSSTSGNT